jgi:hypothetical protein
VSADGVVQGADAGAAPARQIDNDLLAVCALSWAAALIHVQAAGWHVHEYLPFAASFALLAVAQLGWGVAVYRRPASRRILWAGLWMSVAVAALWLASRTVGLPVGPERWSAEPIGAADVIATADEVVLAVLVGLRLASRAPGSPARVAPALGMVTALALVSLSSLSFMFAAH